MGTTILRREFLHAQNLILVFKVIANMHSALVWDKKLLFDMPFTQVILDGHVEFNFLQFLLESSC
jgi:hypothetical protein